MLTRIHISSFVGLTIVAWMIALWAQGMSVLSVDFLRPFTIVAGVIYIVATLFSRYAWAWKIFQGWYVKRPDIRGTWKVELNGDQIDPVSNENPPPLIAYMVVRQTLMSLSMRLMTAESRSKLIGHSIEQEEDGLYRVAGIYRNEPQIKLQGNRSDIHYGSFLLEIHGNSPDHLEGHYWTDRNTRGTMRLVDRQRAIFDTYVQAQEGFEE